MIRDRMHLLAIKYSRVISDPFPDLTREEQDVHMHNNLLGFFSGLRKRSVDKSRWPNPWKAYQIGYEQAYQEIAAACESKRVEIEDATHRGDAWRFAAVAVVEAELKAEREKAKELVEALEDIEEWWDIKNPACVVPAIEPGNPLGVRNDSMAAGSIIKAIGALAKYRGE